MKYFFAFAGRALSGDTVYGDGITEVTDATEETLAELRACLELEHDLDDVCLLAFNPV